MSDDALFAAVMDPANRADPYRLYERRHKGLCCSLSYGRVGLWNFERSLKTRPDRRGEELAVIGDADGEANILAHI